MNCNSCAFCSFKQNINEDGELIKKKNIALLWKENEMRLIPQLVENY
jgi:hypothetical protein